MRSGPLLQQDGTSRTGQDALSISQQRLWMLEWLDPENPVHNISRGLRLTGCLDAAALDLAWREVAQPHKILRTRFHSLDGTPHQVVLPSFSGQLSTLDLSAISSEERGSRLSQLAREEARRPFDLSSGLLLRASLWRLTPSEHVFLLVAHRIICDEASLEVLLHKMALQYGASQDGRAEADPPAPIQYSELVSRQSAGLGEHLSYWKRQLAGIPSLDLPIDRTRPPQQTSGGTSQRFSIGKPTFEQLRSLVESRGTTLFVALLAAFAVFLSRYSRQDDLVVGVPVLGRNDPNLETLVGPLENMVALRTDLSGGLSFNELLTRLHNTTEEAFSHQEVRFETLLEQLPLDRDLSRSPIFQVAFRFRPAPINLTWGGVVSATAFEVESGTERFDMSLDLKEAADAIEGKISYSSDLFETSTMVRMTEQFAVLLAGLAADPARRIIDISPLTESERRKVLIEFNATATNYRRDLCIHDFFEQQVERTPEATALICEHQRLTYGELNARANQLAHFLRTQSVGPEILVGICVERSLDLLLGILGILKAGGAYVPLDPAYPKERLAAILEDARPPILLAQKSSAKTLPDHAAHVVLLDEDWPDIAGQPASNPVRDVTSHNLAYVLFTSGSTGRPKGVALEHLSAGMLIQWAREVFLREETAGTLFSTSICFDLSVFEIFVPLSSGGKVIIAQNALGLPKLPAAREVTLINTVPSAIAELVRMGGVPSSVQVVNLAGEALSTSLAHQIYEETKVQKVYNLYGPTEDTTYSTYTLVPRGKEVTIGKPLPNTQAYILDENRHPLPIGVPGELYLSGDGLARGYFGRDDLTKERFVPNPFANQSGARMYRTGDLACFLADGNIHYLGRIDNQVKLRGFRIELAEIEVVLASHPSVQAAVVIVREDVPGDKRLVAYVIPSGPSVSSALLKDLVRQQLPEYMVPSAFVEVKALPLSPNGKINRRLLPTPDWSTAQGAEVVQPTNELEATLVGIWQAVLGVPNISIRDNFFDLGGHSLMAARVLTEVKKKTGTDLPFSALFRGATVESLARLIGEREDTSDPVVLEIQQGKEGRLPFFAIVPPGEESLGYAILARHMGPEQTVYKIQGHSPVTGGKRPYSDQEMKALTEEYITAMRRVQRHGPYCLGGMCDGTHIAEQIVLSLESQGDEVGLFAIFDTWVLQHSQNRWLWKVYYYRQRLREMRKLNFSERLASYKRVVRNKVQHLAGSKPPRTDWQHVYWPEGFSAARFRAPVVLFKRPKQPFYYINDPGMGWSARTASGVEIHEVDFHHQEILRDPHVRIFGEELAKRLTRIVAGPAAPTENREPSLVTASRRQLGS